VLDSGDVLEAVTMAKIQLQAALAENRALQDSLVYIAEKTRLERAKLEIQRETRIRTKIREAGRKIGDLQLQRQYDLPAERRDLENQIRERTVKLGTLSPLQRVGSTMVSDKPVRPRKLRATLILVFLGALGGLVLAFVWDYLVAHRREILRS
jgi:hypothetical protein